MMVVVVVVAIVLHCCYLTLLLLLLLVDDVGFAFEQVVAFLYQNIDITKKMIVFLMVAFYYGCCVCCSYCYCCSIE